MSTHPNPHDKPAGPAQEGESAQPNPTQLPVEPEFGPMLPPAEPEDPGVTAPSL